jgi:hypothetical protein
MFRPKFAARALIDSAIPKFAEIRLLYYIYELLALGQSQPQGKDGLFEKCCIGTTWSIVDVRCSVLFWRFQAFRLTYETITATSSQQQLDCRASLKRATMVESGIIGLHELRTLRGKHTRVDWLLLPLAEAFQTNSTRLDAWWLISFLITWRETILGWM